MARASLAGIAGAVVLGTVLGLLGAGFAIRGAGLENDIRNGPWATSLVTGSPEADLYTRARVSVGGLLALDKKETLYFNAGVNDAGEPLRGDCRYRVEGQGLAARWWSITAYAADGFLIPNKAGRYSFSKTTLPMGADGSFAFRVSAGEVPGPWLPVKEGERFDLTLRLYNPDPSVTANPATTPLPRIVREGCR